MDLDSNVTPEGGGDSQWAGMGKYAEIMRRMRGNGGNCAELMRRKRNCFGTDSGKHEREKNLSKRLADERNGDRWPVWVGRAGGGGGDRGPLCERRCQDPSRIGVTRKPLVPRGVDGRPDHHGMRGGGIKTGSMAWEFRGNRSSAEASQGCRPPSLCTNEHRGGGHPSPGVHRTGGEPAPGPLLGSPVGGPSRIRMEASESIAPSPSREAAHASLRYTGRTKERKARPPAGVPAQMTMSM